MTTLATRPSSAGTLDPVDIITAPAGSYPLLTIAAAYARLGERPIPLCDPKHEFVWKGHSEGYTRGDGSATSPCAHPGKAPMVREFPRFAHEAASIEELLAMFRPHPSGNIGGVVPAGRIVLDLDPRNGGVESLDRYVREFGTLSFTPTARTGGGGNHFHFLLPEGFSDRLGDGGSLASVGFPGLDWKAAGSQVVLAPSAHTSGGFYLWEPDSAIGEVPFAQIPLPLLDLVVRSQANERKRSAKWSKKQHDHEPQPEEVQAYFARLWATMGVPLQAGDFHYVCPFHPDGDPSLHIDSARCIWWCFGDSCNKGGGVRGLEAFLGQEKVRSAGPRAQARPATPAALKGEECASAFRAPLYPNSDAQKAAAKALQDGACYLFPLPPGVVPEVVTRVMALKDDPSKAMRQQIVSNSWDNECNRAMKRRLHWEHLWPKVEAAAKDDAIYQVIVQAPDWSDQKRQAIAAQVRRMGGQYAAFDCRTAAGVVRLLTDKAISGSLKVEDARLVLFEALRDLDMPTETTKARVHLVWLSRGWAMGGHESKGLMILVAIRTKGAPVDDEAEEAEARKLGLETWQGHERKLEEWGPPRFYGLREDVAAALTKEQALDQVLSALMALGYRVLPKAVERVIGQPQGAP